MIPVVFDKEEEEHMEGQREKYEKENGPYAIQYVIGMCVFSSFARVSFHGSRREYRASLRLHYRRG